MAIFQEAAMMRFYAESVYASYAFEQKMPAIEIFRIDTLRRFL